MSAYLSQQPELLTRSVSVASLYLEHSHFVRRVLRLHGVTGCCLEDGVQDVFLVAFRRFGEFVPNASHRTWLFGISTRVAKDYRRRARRRGGLSELNERVIPCSRSDPYAAASTAQTLRILERRLAKLDENRRRVFILSEIEEMTVPEIAKTLSVKLNTVYSRLRSARREFGVSSKREARAITAAHSRLTLPEEDA